MSDESQISVPPSFIALFLDLGRLKPRQPRAHILERYELCEDLAQMLVDTALERQRTLGITEADALERVRRGLADGEIGLDERESGWVLRRLAELLGWDAGEADGGQPPG